MGMFGPNQKEVWTRLADEIGADYVEGGFWKGGKVQVQVENWIIVLDTYVVSTGKSAMTYTRMRAPFINPQKFYFSIHKGGFFSVLGELLGMSDIVIGDQKFDDEFVVKGNDEKRVKELFSNEELRELFERQPSMSIKIKDDEGYFAPHFPANADELYFAVPGVIKDIDRLKVLFETFATVLNQLCEMGVATNELVDVELK